MANHSLFLLLLPIKREFFHKKKIKERERLLAAVSPTPQKQTPTRCSRARHALRQKGDAGRERKGRTNPQQILLGVCWWNRSARPIFSHELKSKASGVFYTWRLSCSMRRGLWNQREIHPGALDNGTNCREDSPWLGFKDDGKTEGYGWEGGGEMTADFSVSIR